MYRFFCSGESTCVRQCVRDILYIYLFIDFFFILIQPLRRKGFGRITERYRAIQAIRGGALPLRRNGSQWYRRLSPPWLWP